MRMDKKKLISLLLIMVMLLSLTPLAAFANEGTAACRFTCEETTATVTVYDVDGQVVGVGEDGIHHLVPGTYYYSASAKGYKPIEMQAFTVPDGAEEHFERIVMVALTEEETAAAVIEGELRPAGGIFAAHYGVYQVFDVQRRPHFPRGTQSSPDAITFYDLAAPFRMDGLSEEDYFYFVGVGYASEVGYIPSDGWNSKTEGLDPYVVSLHFVSGTTDTELGWGVIGAFASRGFLFELNGGKSYAWFSNEVGYQYASTSICYNPMKNGRLICDLGILVNCPAQSMLPPDPDAPTHVHNWQTSADGNVAVFRCTADGCPYGTNIEYSMTLTIPAFVLYNRQAEARLERSTEDEDWPDDLEQNIISYVGRGETEYKESINPPTAVGTYTAKVTVGYRKDTRVLEADFAIVTEEPTRFEQSKTVGGVVVTVKAEAGVFPAEAVLSVTKAGDEATEAAVAAARGKDQNLVASYGVDIQVTDKEGNILQPADGHDVNVSLMLAEAADANLETRVYRVTKDTAGALAATTQSVNASGGYSAAVETDGSLSYVVELTYPNKCYSLKGSAAVAVDDILAAVGMSGPASKVEVKDPEVLYAYEKNGAWRLAALRSFADEQSVKVTVRSQVYEIGVEDGDVCKAHVWSVDNGTDPVFCTVCGELKVIAEGGSFDMEFDDDRWIALGDAKADTENYVDWDKMFEGFELSGNQAEDLVKVATSQIGYKESQANYAMNARRVRNGYTRYGAWYGIPYGEWCAMFVSFCMHYAGIADADMPYNSGCEAWVEKLDKAGLYAAAANYRPKAGDLIFYDFDEDSAPDHVGIISGVNANSGMIFTIEGNFDDVVKAREIGCYDRRILGYAFLPGTGALEEKTLSVTVGDQTVTVKGNLPADAVLTVVPVPLETAAAIYEKQTGEKTSVEDMVFACDVYIQSGGKKFDLEFFGDSITVSVSNTGLEKESVDVLHVKVDITDEQGELDEAKLQSLTTEEAEKEILKGSMEDGDVVFGLFNS